MANNLIEIGNLFLLFVCKQVEQSRRSVIIMDEHDLNTNGPIAKYT